jgi:uncharacterized oxidoreductase
MHNQTTVNYALVTGASTGIGLALTKLLLKTHHVIAVSRTLGELADIEARNLSHWPYDLTSNSDRVKLIVQANRTLPYLNLLVNNAGVQVELSLENHNWSRYQQEIELNLKAPIHLSLELNDLLVKARTAKIINMGSVLGFSHRKASPIYSVTKAGVHRFSQILNADNKQVGVLEFIPPMTATNMTQARGDQGLMSSDALAEFMVSQLHETGVIYVGKVRLAMLLHRFMPKLLSRLMNKQDQ